MTDPVSLCRVVDGKRYDTDTARHLCHIRCTETGGDFGWENTDLYVTKKGTYFLAGEGNASSRWGQRAIGGGSIPGVGVKPIAADEARHMLEQEDETFLIEELFEVEDA